MCNGLQMGSARTSDARETDRLQTFNQISQSAVYRQDDVSVSLTVCGGSYGGGSEVIVICGLSDRDGACVNSTERGTNQRHDFSNAYA
jgi:hypothetical protein